jgi:hypothetical protein
VSELLRRLTLIVLLAFALALALLFATDGISGQVDSESARFLEDSVRRSAVQCYALEGSFPSDTAYLEEHYNLVIDRNRYAVYYESMGSNLLPQIRVVALPG